MTFKTILAVVQDEADVERVADAAIGLAERFGAHLIGLHAEALPMAFSGAAELPDPGMIALSSEINREQASAVATAFAAKMQAADASFEWRAFESFSGDSARSGVASARSVDLVLAAGRDPTRSAEQGDVDSLLYDAGRPVLVTPFSGPSLTTFKRIIVAWNGSREAARAVFDALPFMIDAEKTEILIVDPPEGDAFDEAGVDLAASLARHGISVSVHNENSDGRSTDVVIGDRLVATGADLLVLGAYSHSWLKQMLFGGVTRTVLQSLPVAAFMSR